MKRPGIRAQLTAWYSLILGLSLATFCCVAYLAMLFSISKTVQSNLRDHMEGARDIIAQDAPEGRTALIDELREFADGLGSGGRMRVSNPSGLLFASPGMSEPMMPRRGFSQGRPMRARIDGESFLILRQNVENAGTNYDVTMAIATGRETFDHCQLHSPCP